MLVQGVCISIRVKVPVEFQYGRYQSFRVPGCVQVCVCVRLRGREGGIGQTAAESEGVCSDRPTTPLSVVVDVQWSQSTGE